MVQKAEALTDDAEKAVRGSNLDHWIPPQKKCENTNGFPANRSLNLLPILGENDGYMPNLWYNFEGFGLVIDHWEGSHLKNTIRTASWQVW